MSIQELEDQKNQCLEAIAVRDMILRLENSKDFQELILKKFCVDECARFVQMSGDINLSADERNLCLQSAQAAGHLLRFFQARKAMGAYAADQLEEVEAAIEEERIKEA